MPSDTHTEDVLADLRERDTRVDSLVAETANNVPDDLDLDAVTDDATERLSPEVEAAMVNIIDALRTPDETRSEWVAWER